MLVHKMISSCNAMEPREPTCSPLTTISCLPVELLVHVFSFLDGPAPSDLRLHDQPHADMLRTDGAQSQPLKSVSLVSWRWRTAVLPLLFRNVIWCFDRFDLMHADHLRELNSSNDNQDGRRAALQEAIPLLSFIRDYNLTSYVRTLTLVVQSTRTTRNGDHGDGTSERLERDVGLYRRGDGSGQYGYSPDPLSPLPRPVRTGEKDLVFNEDSNWLWDLVFGVINPLRFTLIASPRMLAFLLARMLYLGDEWSFSQSHHVLSLSREDPKELKARATSTVTDEEWQQRQPAQEATHEPHTPATSTSRPASSLSRPMRAPSALFTLRPWTSLLLNEGSSTRVYKTYEYFHKRPPSLLGALLGAETPPNDTPLIPPTLLSLSYVGIFPLSSHVATLVRHLPPLEHLFVQLAPRNDILQDRRETAHLDLDDLWAERNTTYGMMVPKLFDDSDAAGNWRRLGRFESGDAADTESWEMAVDYVEARRDFSDWRVEKEGVFVKREGQRRREVEQMRPHRLR